MPQSFSKVHLHVVFSTKNRAEYLIDPTVRRDMHAYLGGICRGAGCPAIIVGGFIDHVHILCLLSRTTSIGDLVRDLKRDSSKWVKTKAPTRAEFDWQDGYGAFAVSPAHVPPLEAYIANQEEHHQVVSFQDEYRRILKKYQVEWDERYVWE